MPNEAASSMDVRFDAAEVRQLVRDLRVLADGKPIVAALRRNLRKAAEPIKQQVQANAAWSSRIPAAVAIGTAFTDKRTGVFIKVDRGKAPHARAYENGGVQGTFRHPVFGHDIWVQQQARPFFFNEINGHVAEVELAAGFAVAEAALAHGFS